ncbi:hypothetical protein PTSG_11655 [Salpingoeca rosetta]|uniref:Uncharacterized protein n=1 Tax=Salpingoeca rosetta (strain ATCC 50818 / BSB-021) TaxID=946362 RepID=F2TXU3_SALR5|nr:uncharacterized protein PTSG_11655 [Salpingoeca rosetta]EGD76202.1 hypothetical protein PTSG_11655 [Salpingoeca rosetta]|eukprot:XP_004998377.1 hypothetical protein PTSG_11655 [Salpingoeca rosetta]
MIGRLIGTVKKYPEVTPLLVVCSFAASFGIFSLTRFVTSNPEVSLNHRETNWETSELKAGRIPDRVLQLHAQDKQAAFVLSLASST